MNKIRLGDYIEKVDLRNASFDYGLERVRGVNNSKEFIKTKANLDGRNLSKFKVVKSNWFVFNHRTSRNGSKFSIAVNLDNNAVICTEDYVVFKIRESKSASLLPLWLYIYFNRPEFDRYVITNSWGSSTEFFNWEDLCEVELEVPPIGIQRKYVAIYEGLLGNLHAYEQRLDDLKLVCEGFVERLRDNYKPIKIGPYIEEINERNDGRYHLFQGVNVDCVFAEPKRVANDSNSGKVVHENEFAFNKVMKANCTKLPIALRKGPTCVISGSYSVFKIVKPDILLSDYLMLWLKRDETQRWAGFVSYGTTRDIFDFNALCELQIPIPEIGIQRAICQILLCANQRKRLYEDAKRIISNICSTLVRGSLQEANGL